MSKFFKFVLIVLTVPVLLLIIRFINAKPGKPNNNITQVASSSAGPKLSASDAYNILIADRGNNRIIEVTPDKKIIWEYQFNLPQKGMGADDAFFINGGRQIIANLETDHVIDIIDYQTKQIIWSYGHPGQPGSAGGYLNTPDDAYKLSNGDVIVADIKNNRVIEINPHKNIVHEYKNLSSPNGDTPLPDGHILISNIHTRSLTELDQNWQPVFSLKLPVSYPSDPQLTRAGNILISDYSNPGKIVELNRQGKIVWQFMGDGQSKLNKPSIAVELPNGNILATDDLNNRVIIIDKNFRRVVWSFDQVSVPDGVDFISS